MFPKLVLVATMALGASALTLGPKSRTLRGLGSYDQSQALTYVYLAGIAYCSQEQIMAWDCPGCSQVGGIKPIGYAYDEKLNVAGYVALANQDTTAIVSFRGTEPSSLKDWIDDLKFAKSVPMDSCSGCEVHDGFYDSYLALRPQILQALSEAGSQVTDVVVTGHSLGAAMSALAGFDLSQSLDQNVYVEYTFGLPRVGNEAFAQAFAETFQAYRVVHYADIVPHLPPELLGFSHTPTEVWYNEQSTNYSVCNGSGEDASCSDSLSSFDYSIEDHLHYLNVPISDQC